jgi:hypothetical protein
VVRFIKANLPRPQSMLCVCVGGGGGGCASVCAWAVWGCVGVCVWTTPALVRKASSVLPEQWEGSAGVVPLRQMSRSFSRSKGEGAARTRNNSSQFALPSQQVASLEGEAGPASLALSQMTQKGEGHAADLGAPCHGPEEDGGGEQEPPRKVARGLRKPRVVAGRGRSLLSRKR